MCFLRKLSTVRSLLSTTLHIVNIVDYGDLILHGLDKNALSSSHYYTCKKNKQTRSNKHPHFLGSTLFYLVPLSRISLSQDHPSEAPTLFVSHWNHCRCHLRSQTHLSVFHLPISNTTHHFCTKFR